MRLSKTKLIHTNKYTKVILLALFTLLFAVCFMAAALSTHSGQALQSGGTVLKNTSSEQKAATPRATGDVNYSLTLSDSSQGSTKTDSLNNAIIAINGSSYGGTITLTENVAISTIITTINNHTTLNLGTKKLSFSMGQFNVISPAKFTVTGTTGVLTNSKNTTINYESTGTLSVMGGTIGNTATGDYAAINNVNSATVDISGKDTRVTSSGGKAIYNQGGKVNINEGTVEATSLGGYAIYNKSAHINSVTINGGTVKAVGATNMTAGTATGGAAIYNAANGAINITGGTVSSTGETGTAVFNADAGEVNVGGQTTSSGSSTGTIMANAMGGIGIFNMGTGSVYVATGKIEATKDGGYAIYNKSTLADTAVYINGGLIKAIGATNSSAATANGAAIYNVDSGTVTIDGGTVEATGDNGTAIFNEGAGAVNVSTQTSLGITTTGTVTASGATTNDKNGIGIFNKANGIVTVSAGLVAGKYGILNADFTTGTGAINISGGEVKSFDSIAIWSNFGPVNVSGGFIHASTGSAIYQRRNATIKVTGGTVSATGAGHAIYAKNTSYGVVEFIDGSVTAEEGSAIYIDGPKHLTIRGGTVHSNSGAAVYNNGTKTTITGGTISSDTGLAIDNTNGKTLVIANAPEIISGEPAAIKSSVAIYGAMEDASNPYSGTTTIKVYYSDALAVGTVIVKNNTDLTKFLLTNDYSTLEVIGSDLAAKIISYTVTIDYKGVLTNDKQQIDTGEKATKPADPSAKGFLFNGWFTDDTYAATFDFDTPITNNTTVYAKWDLDVKNLTDIDLPYDGAEHELTPEFNSLSENYTYSYSWKKDGTAVGTPDSPLAYKLVNQSGEYTCTITATPKTVGIASFTKTLTVDIKVNNTEAYNAFMAAHSATINVDAATMTYEQFSGAVKNMVTAYGNLTQLEYDQLSEDDKNAKILVLQKKYDAIATAKAAADTALAAIGTDSEATLNIIRLNGLTAFEAKIADAKTAMQAYTALSGGLKESDLENSNLPNAAKTFIDNYRAQLALANAAIVGLNNKTAQGIKKGTYSLAEVKALYAAATDAYNNFYAVGGDNTAVHPDLDGYSKIAKVAEEIATYEGYKAFYDKYKNTWETALTGKVKKEEARNMQDAYNELSNKSKTLLEETEIQSIISAIQKFATNNTALNVVLIVANGIMAIIIAGTILFFVKMNNLKKKDDTTQNN